MKKLFIIAVCVMAMSPGSGYGASFCIPASTLDSSFVGQYDCNDETKCTKCNSMKEINSTANGITMTSKSRWTQESTVPGKTPKCGCLATETYSCASGYYGTATSPFAGCTKCPDNAICAGGNGSGFACAKGYYKNGSTCSQCPPSGTTTGTGATAITDCYLPSGTTFSESTGSGTYTADCKYTK